MDCDKTIYEIQILTLIMEKFTSTILVVRGAAAFLNNVYPWFVASGKEGRNTDSSPKLIQTNSTNAWSDFLAIETDKYTMGMNILGTELLQQGAIKHSGIIAADFPIQV